MSISNQTMDEKNFPNESDTTAELIRKHKIYKSEWDRIIGDDIKRGEDYWGGYDDSIANDMTEIEDWLWKRAIMRHDAEAGTYINEHFGTYAVSNWINIATEALTELQSGNIAKAIMLLKNIKRDDYDASPPDPQAENKRLREMLHKMTRMTDWMTEGYSLAEYNALVDEFEQESEDDD